MHRKVLNRARSAIMATKTPRHPPPGWFYLADQLPTNFPVLLGGGRRSSAFRVTTVEEVGTDEGIKITVHDLVHVASLYFRAVIFNELVRLHGVGADLAAEADFGFGGVEFVQSFAALLKFQLVKLRTKNFHSPFAIFVLAAFILALHDDSGRKMCDADGGFNFVDVLTTVAAGAECVDAEVVGFDH